MKRLTAALTLLAPWFAMPPLQAAPSGTIVPTDPAEELRSALAEFDEGQQLLAANPDRARRSFRSAAERFTRILDTGVVNGRLEFNAGNAYLQAGDVGRAILHYRRAERLVPRDPLLADNLGEAMKRCVTTIAPKRSEAVLQTLLFWHYETSIRERAFVAVLLWVGVWTLLAVRNFVPRRSLSMAACVIAALAMVAAGSVAAQRWADRTTPSGVVLGMDVTVYKGPGTGYQRQFEQPLQPGIEFRRREARAGWWNVVLPDGQSGWIDATTAELVPV